MPRTRIFGVLVLALACRPGAISEVARPRETTVAAAVGDAPLTCNQSIRHSEPLAVDFGPELRGNLEVAMKRGVAVVAYDCDRMKVLPDCAIDGTYGFLGMTNKEQLIRLENANEIKANLPIGGGALSAKLGGELARGTVLDIALVMIGKKSSTWQRAARRDLKGDCAGATHFVRGATVGAFVVESSSEAKVRSVAQVFSAGVDAKDSSSRMIRNQDGYFEECRAARPEAAAPPGQCGALLRLELIQVQSEEPGPAVAQAGTQGCPEGWVFSDGKCTMPTATDSHLCKPQDRDECLAQCGRGNVESCFQLGWILENGIAGPRDLERALSVYKQACDGGSAPGCRGLGFLYALGKGTPLDHGRAFALFQKACAGADAAGCGNQGAMTENGWGVKADPASAFGLYKKGCDGGDANSCDHLGRFFDQGVGIASDALRAAALYKQACDGGHWHGCTSLAWMQATGKGVAKDETRAAQLFEASCKGGDANGCSSFGWMIHSGRGIAKDPKRGVELMQKGCQEGNAWGCERLKALGQAK